MTRTIGEISHKISLTIDRINEMKDFLPLHVDNIEDFVGDWYNPLSKKETLIIKKNKNKYYCELKIEDLTTKGFCYIKEVFLYIGKKYEWIRLRELCNNFFRGQVIYFPQGDGSANSRYMIKKQLY